MPAAPLVRMVVGAAAPSRGALLRAMLPRVANTVAHLHFRIRLAQRRMRGRESDAMDLGPNRVGRQRFVRPNRMLRRVHRVGIVRRTGQARSSIGIAGQCCPLWPEKTPPDRSARLRVLSTHLIPNCQAPRAMPRHASTGHTSHATAVALIDVDLQPDARVLDVLPMQVARVLLHRAATAPGRSCKLMHWVRRGTTRRTQAQRQ
jgi:hypothetical protein